MNEGGSRTAWGVARLRALHQLRDGGAILPDPFAVPLLGLDPAVLLRRPDSPELRRVRRAVAARSRIGEAFLARAAENGVRQVVVLGAGFDTFALRNTDFRLRVFEVDHPATQARKRAQLSAAALPPPACLRFVPADFERDDLCARLRAAGFDSEAPAFFLMLGVLAYLTRDAIDALLRRIVGLPGAELVFDYAAPPEAYPARLADDMAERRRRVAAIGEPWVSPFRREDMAALLRSHGFAVFEDLDAAAIEAWLAAHTPGMPGRRVAASHLAWARAPHVRP